MKIWKVILATLVIFSAGVLAGARLAQLRHEHGHGESGDTRQPNGQPHGTNHESRLILPGMRPPGRGFGKEFMERMDREMALTPEQRKQIEAIMEESQKHAREIWKKVEPEMHTETTNSHAQIRAVLTPEQAAKFDELMKRPKPGNKEGQSTNNPPPPGEGPPPGSPHP